MIENITQKKKEKFILVAVEAGNGYPAERSVEELSLLLDTAGGETVGRMIQNMEFPSAATYIGSGKVEELQNMMEMLEADGIVCDDELSPAQMSNLEEALHGKILDRTMLILDIFAQHATTSEGKIQVEMAQLEYMKSRLAGSYGAKLSRQGGGIGTRGPGESQLETDRRVIQKRISVLRRQVREMEQNRDTMRKRRERNGMPVVAIVGYTNAGKSTLLNKITDSDVYMQNQLFATLDPTTRNGILPDGQKLLFTDTVGFIHKLPHNLVEAFHSTLEEAKYADVILHVVDASDPDLAMHMDVVYQTLQELHVEGKPIITICNKCDLPNAQSHIADSHGVKVIRASAATGEGLDALFTCLSDTLRQLRVYVDRVIPYSDGKLVNIIHEHGQILSEEYEEDGVHIKAYVPGRFL